MLVLVVLLVRRARGATSTESAPVGARAGEAGGGTVATVIGLALTVLILGVGGVTGFYIFKAGDSGAHMVWGGI